ncbi:asparagine synthase (glutamine-hydrolyzing) [Kordia sp. YSTF-M3]|uniref:asparagine synthase (glutamine-hydrolyzing) n=1 Tax=Kordia aestuariivivens TaxID=2759037 RepID=A0ABR7Q9U7_9FLAO|nr:asparagine synthase (glutamine-hydrolyzing) [Kordia aestuariivivens]MBC8755336.1 asparagine synthase (glutamine-hydrolyzing) [Kordia aestuariivivens]
MCGILGVIAYNKIVEKDKEVIALMQQEIVHRGPDNQSVWNDDSVVFAHNRLSIIDLSDQANQPMIASDDSVVISYNGEVYNYEEIKKDLIGKQEFKTDHSDTEVIINAYKEWGIDGLLKRLRGMFAFALYDKKTATTFLVRDRLGKKPLYYATVANKIYFSSETKPLLKADEIDAAINEESIYHYLTFLTVNAPNTFYKHIKKLEAGNYLKITAKKEIEQKEYWSITNAINTTSLDSYEKAQEKFKEKLEVSMQLRNISDVPISIALSGGVDSSLNLYYSAQKNPSINAINLEYQTNHEFNESDNARKYANTLGLEYHQMQINAEEYEKQLLDLQAIQTDAPFGDASSVLLYYISKKVKAIGSKVLLVGEGGDELGGYPVYIKIQKEYNILKLIPKFLRKYLKYIPLAKPFDFFYDNKIISRRQVHGFTEHEKKKFWKKGTYNSYEILGKLMDEVTIETKDAFLKKVLNIEYKLRLPELILAKVDYSTMAASIEARSPYMDYKLIEYCASLPFELKMKNGAKSIIKDVAKNILPDYIVNGKKVGFGMLLHPFLTISLPKMFQKEIIENPEAPVKEFIDEKYLKKLMSSKTFSPKKGYRLWIMYSLNIWLSNQKK